VASRLEKQLVGRRRVASWIVVANPKSRCLADLMATTIDARFAPPATCHDDPT
jgi:hypothetical protein